MAAPTKLCSGHTATDFSPEEMEQYNKVFTGKEDVMITLQPGGWVVPKGYLKFQEKIYNLKFRRDDVVIMTYPKCGTTWTQEMVWTMRNNPNLDNPAADEALFVRSPFIEWDMLLPDFVRDLPPEGKEMDSTLQGYLEKCPGMDPNNGISFNLMEVIKGPRTLKTHLPFSLLDKDLLDTCKVVYVARNPKDALLSYQHHSRLIRPTGFTGTQDQFVDYFVNNKLIWCPYGEHLREVWKLRGHPNLHFIFYEDLKADVAKEMRKLDRFIGSNLTEEQFKNVIKRTSFSSMQANDPIRLMSSSMVDREVAGRDGPFIRKGEAGAWRGKFTPEQEAKIDSWIQDNFSGLGLNFNYS